MRKLPVASALRRLRVVTLNVAFELLYRRLVFFHELAGRFLLGDAWHARRVACLARFDHQSFVIDLGAGEGRLVAEAARRLMPVLGVEPSNAMRQSALRRGALVVAGSSFSIPLPDARAGAVVITYPGNWILNGGTWSELRRISRPGTEIVVLLGGTYRHGPWSGLRSTLIGLAYGRGVAESFKVPAALEADFSVAVKKGRDQWGEYALLIARR